MDKSSEINKSARAHSKTNTHTHTHISWCKECNNYVSKERSDFVILCCVVAKPAPGLAARNVKNDSLHETDVRITYVIVTYSAADLQRLQLEIRATQFGRSFIQDSLVKASSHARSNEVRSVDDALLSLNCYRRGAK